MEESLLLKLQKTPQVVLKGEVALNAWLCKQDRQLRGASLLYSGRATMNK